VLAIRLSPARGNPAVLALPTAEPAGDGEAALLPVNLPAARAVTDEAEAFLGDVGHTGTGGELHVLPRPMAKTRRLLLFGVGGGDEAGWRAAGAALARAASRESALSVALPVDAGPAAVRGLAEGLLLASYRFRRGADHPTGLRQVTVLGAQSAGNASALGAARAVVEATYLARDLTNMPSLEKSPAWFAERVEKAAGNHPALRVSVRDPKQLAAEGFGGILAVGGGSTRGPRLLELGWRPRGARRHVVLIGKGITFDSGGICIKPREGMKLMRKDMGGAAAICAATLGAAALNLPVRITALAPLAENMVSGGSMRPGDVVRHYGGQTSEILNTDAEGRVVLADALAYAVRRVRPDVIVDLATLTGANAVALGKRTAALYSDNGELADQLIAAGAAAGEKMWRLPLADDYLEQIGSDLADVANSSNGGAGSITAALFLREFVGSARDRWAHLDMSAPSWADGTDGELVKGATGWGVRTLLRWLEGLATG
jgi:leucyl aminopeptidase